MNNKTAMYIIFCKASLITSLCLSGLPALALNFPAKPLRMVVPFSAGSGTDIMARTVALKIAEHWGQQVVDNRAGGTVAAPMLINSNGALPC